MDLTANELRFRFEGTNQRIYNIAMCSVSFTIQPHTVWQEVNPQRIDRGASQWRNIRGEYVTTPGRSPRWEVGNQLPLGFFHGNNLNRVQGLMDFLEANPNFFYFPNQTDFPYLFYPATLEGSSIEISYVGQQYNQQQLSFAIAEM